MVINILAGGPEDLLPNLQQYKGDGAIWVGVDRGVFHLLKRNITPEIAFGDFDSVSPEELALIETKVAELKRFQPIKNETDTELALNWALAQRPKTIRLFGATGGRLDHLFANVQLLVQPLKTKQATDIYLIDRCNEMFIKGPGMYELKKRETEKYISFIPLTLEISNLTLSGFKYPLKNRHISLGSTLCISNELISEYGTFSFSEGILIVVRSHD
ncbi:thiamine diphosphokinase [Neobacillus sp. OS1-32]|jgi:thiamine pyrophosphokinase|uniref:Thiamine diphosphokinase n=1 Tax=Neobacillus paridis TaxID=2803862 RepID=A0ABS1TN81_9BACI|nr:MULTISPECIES: thiamine diphosphokinase [Neobacillus]MBL4952638.1 thiamine diphosphokinase [Neobacillus paridis]WML31852.1 thiamine diphosphokinase [Neobacillus sp. OS1-32]